MSEVDKKRKRKILGPNSGYDSTAITSYIKLMITQVLVLRRVYFLKDEKFLELNLLQ